MALDYEDPFDSSGGGNSTAVPTDPTDPPADPIEPDPPPKVGDKKLIDGKWHTWNGTYWVADAVNTPPNTTGPKPGDRRASPKGPDYFEEYNGTTWVTYDTAGGGGGGGGSTPISSVPGADGEMAGVFDWPGFESAGPFRPRRDTFEYKPFAYDPYQASSWQDAEKEPGYGASRDQLRKQIEAGAAHRGMLRSGMTIGDLYTGLVSLGQQNFANFDNRNFRNYSANRDNAFGNWSANLGAEAQKFGLELGVDRDVYDRRATDIDRGNNYRYNVASSQFQDMLSRWQERVRSLTNIATAGANS